MPGFNEEGDLPVAVYRATVDEVVARFGGATPQREAVTKRLLRILESTRLTGKCDRLVIFGSYVTAKLAPNDVDVVLLMKDDFNWKDCDERTLPLFDHERAIVEFEANVFWTRPSALVFDSVESFIESWQRKRGKGRRGIVIIEA